MGASGVRDVKGGMFRMVMLTAKASYRFVLRVKVEIMGIIP